MLHLLSSSWQLEVITRSDLYLIGQLLNKGLWLVNLPEAGHQLLGEVLHPDEVAPAHLASGELDQGEVHHLPLLLGQILNINLINAPSWLAPLASRRLHHHTEPLPPPASSGTQPTPDLSRFFLILSEIVTLVSTSGGLFSPRPSGFYFSFCLSISLSGWYI